MPNRATHGMLTSVKVRAHVFVSGRVQGVNFRWATAERARTRGVAGWVRNLPDGRVEAVFEGDPGAVEGLIEWCRRGPLYAEVRALEVVWEDPEELEGFVVRGS